MGAAALHPRLRHRAGPCQRHGAPRAAAHRPRGVQCAVFLLPPLHLHQHPAAENRRCAGQAPARRGTRAYGGGAVKRRRKGQRPSPARPLPAVRRTAEICARYSACQRRALFFCILHKKLLQSEMLSGILTVFPPPRRTPLLVPRRQKKRRMSRCGWRCGNVETCRKAHGTFRPARGCHCGGRAVTAKNVWQRSS